MSIKTIKHIFIFAIAILVSTSCAASDISLAQKHLELIKSNNLREANLEYCYPKDKLRLHNLNSFKIISSVSKSVADFKSPLYYTDVVVDIETNQEIGFGQKPQVRINGSAQISIQVWKSDDFYQWSIQTDTRKLSPSLLNKKNQNSKTQTLSITRDEINKNDLCVYMPPNQLEP